MAYTLITGASSGIGLELAKEFAKHGHNLILAARTGSKLEALKVELENTYQVKAETFAADLSIEEERNRLFAYTQSAGMESAKMFHTIGTETAESVAKCGYKAVMKGKAVVYHGKITHGFNIASRLLPRSFVRKRAITMNH